MFLQQVNNMLSCLWQTLRMWLFSFCLQTLTEEYHNWCWDCEWLLSQEPLAFVAYDAYAMWVWDLECSASGLSKYCSHSRHCCEWWRKEMSVIRVTSLFPITESGSKSVAWRWQSMKRACISGAFSFLLCTKMQLGVMHYHFTSEMHLQKDFTSHFYATFMLR